MENMMAKIPKKAKVITDRKVDLSDGRQLSLENETVEVYLTPKGENIWTCKYQGKEFTINKEFLDVLEFEEMGPPS
jgi:co-chaperonin GroES (HSP10)